MTREEKALEIDTLKVKFQEYDNFYVADAQGLTVEEIDKLRMACHAEGVEYRVAKNTLIKRALAEIEGTNEEIYDVFAGPTSIFFSETANVPGKILKEFRKSSDLPVLKAASIDSSIYVGDDQIAVLSELKSKDELIAEVLGLLQSPMKTVISSLQSGENTIAGVVKTLQDKAE